MRVRGGGKVDITWSGGQSPELRLQAHHAVKYQVIYGEQPAEAQVEVGKSVALDGALHKIGR